MRDIVVKDEQNNQKLDKVIFNNFPNLAQNTFYKALRKKDIRVNERRVNENVIVHRGDTIKIFIADELLDGNINFPVVYEDDNILIINKPSGIEVTGINSVTSILKKKYSFIEPAHRIDRNTFGLVLFAKNKQTLDILLKKFKEKEIEKHYHATVFGIPNKTTATLEAYLFKDNKKSLVYISDAPKKGYVKIITSYKVISTNKKDNTSILDITLHTGKTHQIRAHLAYLGYPIIGDRKIWNK